MTDLPNSRPVSFIRDHKGIVSVCLVFCFVGIFSLNNVLVYTPDSARYMAWAKSLGDLQGFRDATTPRPSKYVVHAPLYPLLLAPAAALFPYNVPVAKVETMLFGIAALVAFYALVRKSLGNRWGVLGASLLAFNPATILYSTQVLSDIPFALCVILFFLFALSIDENNRSSLKMEVGTITVAVAGIFLREVGLILVLTGVLFFVWKKRAKTALFLIAVAAVFYLTWYVRNEVIVASIEQPSIRNVQMYFKHLVTPAQASLFDELLARLDSNGRIYLVSMPRLLFLTDLILRNIMAYSPAQAPMSWILRIMPTVYWPLIIATVATVVVGAVSELARRERLVLLLLFLLCYLVPVLSYPINDVRFLFPVLVVMMYFFIVGVKWIVGVALARGAAPWLVRSVLVICIAVLSLPNIGWTITFARNNHSYAESPLAFFNEIRDLPYFPELFARPLDLAGKWIRENTDSASVILCRNKELTLWTGERTVIDVDPATVQDEFEHFLRDFRIQYVVSVFSKGGLRDFEPQFAASEKYEFVTVRRLAGVEIVRVLDKTRLGPAAMSPPDISEFQGRIRFRDAIRLLLLGRSAEAESVLTRLPLELRSQSPVWFNIGVAKEFAGHLEAANAVFNQFRFLQQGGADIQQAWYHQDIIARLGNARKIALGPEKADQLYRVAVAYSVLGYRKQCERLLDSSVLAEPGYFPSLIVRGINAMQRGDTTSARYYLAKSAAIDPTNILVQGLTKILEDSRQLSTTQDSDKRNIVRRDLAEQLSIVGLREEAIDQLLVNLEENPDDAGSLRAIVDLYEGKRRYAPARRYLTRLVELEPGNSALMQEMHELMSRW